MSIVLIVLVVLIGNSPQRSSALSREARSCVASATKLDETQEDDEMRTWLRLELEEGVIVTPTQKIEEKTEGRQSDLETSGGIPSSNGRFSS